MEWIVKNVPVVVVGLAVAMASVWSVFPNVRVIYFYGGCFAVKSFCDIE